MNEVLIFSNLIAWSLQIGALVALAAGVALLLRFAVPQARLAYWQFVLLACLLLPAVRTWERETVAVATMLTFPPVIGSAVRPVASPGVSIGSWILLLIALGCAVRLALLVTGFWRLRRYRKNSVPLAPASAWGVEADIRISPDVSGPVTFGFIDPVVLLPSGFPGYSEAQREAILCHEVLHVRRHDWLFTVAEELVRAVLWFHPAVWWVLGEIQLSREQAVDAEAIGMTRSRDEYVDTLLTVAGANSQHMYPAPLFLRRRHLKQRVVSILKEVRMSKTRSFSALAASLALLAASCWFITGTVPLYGSPQFIADSPGVAVETNGAQLMHRGSVQYPREAVLKHVEGSVTVQVKTDGAGNVIDASILSGPDEFRRAVLQSVLSWHFGRDAVNSTRQIMIAFALPALGAPPTPDFATAHSVVLRSSVVVSTSLPGPDAHATEPSVLRTISIRGLSDADRDALRALLPAHEGDTFTPELANKVVTAVRGFDEHLRFSMDQTSINISTPESVAVIQNSPSTAAPYSGGGMRVGGSFMQSKVIRQVKPEYPPLAKAARVQGTVQLEAVIGTDGTIKNLHLLSGPPLLVQAAMMAVQKWLYSPTLLNGSPVEVVTTIDVSFALSSE